MRFGIALPQSAFEPESFRACVIRAEELGFDSGWTQEQVLSGTPHYAPLEIMTYAAACTTRLRLGCAVFVSSQHSPVHLAKSIATLDQISGGRVEVGVGVGGRNRMLGAFAVAPDGLVSRFTEGVRLMKECWTADTITFDGRFWQVEGASMLPKPAQHPHPPIWFGGSHPNAVRRAVTHANGFFGAGSATTANFAEQVKILRAEPAGQDLPVAKRVYIAVDDDSARARKGITEGLATLYGPYGLSLGPVAVAGTPEECVAGLREVVAAGAQFILLNPLRETREQMERLAAEVIPHVRG